MKRLMMILFAVAFTSGMAFSQDNMATVEQSGNGYEATITQAGYDNEAKLIQGMPGWNQPDMKKEGWIEQTGDNNRADVAQASHRSIAGVEQTGDDNQADVKVAMTTGGGAVAQAYVTQIGDRNTASQDHSGAGYKPDKDYDYMSITQEGDDNTATQYQRTNYFESSAVIEQFGDGNTASQEQQRNMVGEIIQDGDLNTANMIQEGKVGFAQIYQDGDSNQALIESFSNDNSAVVNQTGNSSNAVITQN